MFLNRRSRIWATAVFFLALALLVSPHLSAQMRSEVQAPPQSPALGKVIEVANAPNSTAQQAKPYVVLVSLDGFRYDYLTKYSAPNIKAIAARGASAPDGMIPSYTSTTFPNHLALITGLYPEHHGIVANNFYDPARQQRYTYADHSTVIDGTWYSGVPLWSLAEKNRMRAACYFWPGSEAEIAGKHPSYYLTFDPTVPNDQRIDQVLVWLRLPPEQRPHFITLYIADVDGAGHEFGPDSKETGDIVKTVDAEVGKLVAGLDALHLPVDLFVLADHGMETTSDGWVTLDQFADLSQFKSAGPLMYAPSEADAEKAYQSLKGASDKFKVYRRADVPPELHYDSNTRVGDPVVVATGPYYIRARGPAPGELDKPPSVGTHGYDPRLLPSMRALFVATGPDIRAGATVQSFENVNVYPFIARILGLPIGKIDGDVKVLQIVLKTPAKN
ncbi:MAG: ectonucleotide pyrophosphatase/phosphodiesterase [Candidatus Acidiferrales bacterium]